MEDPRIKACEYLDREHAEDVRHYRDAESRCRRDLWLIPLTALLVCVACIAVGLALRG